MDMLLGIWVIFFIVGLVPGSIFGYLLVKLPLGFGWQVLLSACLAALSGYVISLVVVQRRPRRQMFTLATLRCLRHQFFWPH
jgi:hypothetical protein